MSTTNATEVPTTVTTADTPVADENFATPLMALDGRGEIVFWSDRAAELFAIPAGDARGRPLHDLVSGHPALECLDRIALVATATPGVVASDVVTSDDESHRGRSKLDAWASPGRELVILFSQPEVDRSAADFEELKSRKLESIGQLAAGIAHEINTPMQYVSDNALFLRDTVDRMLECIQLLVTEQDWTKDVRSVQTLVRRIEMLSSPEIREEVAGAFSDALHGIDRVTKIVRAMKTFAHPDNASIEDVDVVNVIDNTITISSNEWKYAAEIVVEHEAGLPTVRANRGQLSQVVLNLIVNAAHAIEDKSDKPKRGKITIRTKSNAGFVEISVQDDGCGMPAHIQERIFDPFFTTKEVGRGTGQGLAIVRSIVVDRLGGKIEIDTTPGAGTTMRVRLPRVSPGT